MLKTKIIAYISPEGLKPLALINKTTNFPKSVEIKIFSKNRLGNWLLKQFVLGRKLILVDIDIKGW